MAKARIEILDGAHIHDEGRLAGSEASAEVLGRNLRNVAVLIVAANEFAGGDAGDLHKELAAADLGVEVDLGHGADPKGRLRAVYLLKYTGKAGGWLRG